MIKLRFRRAIGVHGITDEFLVDKPEYQDIHKEFLDFIKALSWWLTTRPSRYRLHGLRVWKLDPTIGKTDDYCKKSYRYPGHGEKRYSRVKNNLDILCERYGIDNSRRTTTLCSMRKNLTRHPTSPVTGGQTSLRLMLVSKEGGVESIRRVKGGRKSEGLRATAMIERIKVV